MDDSISVCGKTINKYFRPRQLDNIFINLKKNRTIVDFTKNYIDNTNIIEWSIYCIDNVERCIYYDREGCSWFIQWSEYPEYFEIYYPHLTRLAIYQDYDRLRYESSDLNDLLLPALNLVSL